MDRKLLGARILLWLILLVAIGGVAYVGTIAYAVFSAFYGGPKPTDAKLISLFQAHRPQIDALMKTMQADKPTKLSGAASTDPSTLPSSGMEEYRRNFKDIDPQLFGEIDRPRGFYYDPESGSVTIMAWATGLAGSGASKSFMYKPANPIPLVDDLDVYRAPKGQNYILAYRHIEGDWYLEYDAD